MKETPLPGVERRRGRPPRHPVVLGDLEAPIAADADHLPAGPRRHGDDARPRAVLPAPDDLERASEVRRTGEEAALDDAREAGPDGSGMRRIDGERGHGVARKGGTPGRRGPRDAAVAGAVDAALRRARPEDARQGRVRGERLHLRARKRIAIPRARRAARGPRRERERHEERAEGACEPEPHAQV